MSETHAMSGSLDCDMWEEITPKSNQTNKFCAHEFTRAVITDLKGIYLMAR